MKLPKQLKAWIMRQCVSSEALLRPDLERRLPHKAGRQMKFDCRRLYRIIKEIAAEYGYTPGRWRDAADRRFTRFTMDKGRPKHRSSIAEAR